jgi:hypothetical protein
MLLTKGTRPLESPGAGTRLAMVSESDCDEMELLARVGVVSDCGWGKDAGWQRIISVMDEKESEMKKC